MINIGVDLGGTKIEAVALGEDGREYGRLRVPTPRDDYQATLSAIVKLVQSVSHQTGAHYPQTFGIGIPGSLSPETGLVRNANSTWINGKPLKNDLEALLGVEVFVTNDANCLALSEATDGSARGERVVFAVILGTGVGGGLAIDGQVLGGRNGVAGEWGHNPLPWANAEERPGNACFCGQFGCIETFLCGGALEAQYRALSGYSAGAKLIAERAAKGDPQCKAVLDVYANRLARALASVINVVDPDVIVFGGGVSNIPSILTKAHKILPEWMFSDVCQTEFRVSRWGDSSGVRGAARLPQLIRSNAYPAR